VSPQQPDRIRALQAGIAPAYALLAGMQLEVFTALGDESLAVSAIAARIGVDGGRLERLLYALAAAGLVECEAGRFRNGAEAREFLVRGRPRYLGNEHELLSELWHADLQTAASIRQRRPMAEHDFAAAGAAASAAFLRGLVPSSLAFGRDLARRFDFAACGSVLDIGGGPGTALVGLHESNPHLRLTLFELPSILPLAEQILRDRGSPAVQAEAGDIVRAPSRSRHDAALLKAVIQVLSPAAAAVAIRHAFDSLNPGGTLYITGAGILDDSRLSPLQAVYYNLTFMNLYAGGGAYTEGQYRAWLGAAGFAAVERSTLDSGSPLLRATRGS